MSSSRQEEAVQPLESQADDGSCGFGVIGLMLGIVGASVKYCIANLYQIRDCIIYFNALGDIGAQQDCAEVGSSSYPVATNISEIFPCNDAYGFSQKNFTCLAMDGLDYLLTNGTVQATAQTVAQLRALQDEENETFFIDMIIAGLLGTLFGCAFPIVAPMAQRSWQHCRGKVSSSCATFFSSRRMPAELREPFLEMDVVAGHHVSASSR